MAEELITYGMVRDKGYTVSSTKQDNEYAIKEDFQFGGAVGLLAFTNLSEYESNELIENSSIPLSSSDSMIINFSGALSTYSYAFVIGTNLSTINRSMYPHQTVENRAITYGIPMRVYNYSLREDQEVSSGIVSIYRQPTRTGGSWELKASFSVVKGSNISIYVG